MGMSRLVPVFDDVFGAMYSYARTQEDFESLPLKKSGYVGGGSNGKVLLMKSTLTPLKMAAKIFELDFQDEAENEKKKKTFMRETAALQSLRHKNVVGFHFSVMGPTEAMIFMELCPGKALYTETLTKRHVVKYFLDILDALNFIHSKRIVHRDVKVDNVLVKTENHVVLGDFGVSEKLQADDDLVSGRVGTEDFMAPEVFRSKPSSLVNGYKADAYSLGVLLFCMLTRGEPVDEEYQFELWNILTICPPEDFQNDAFMASSTLRDCTRLLLVEDPVDRISVTSLYARLRRDGFYNHQADVGLARGHGTTTMEMMEVTYQGWETLGAEVEIETGELHDGME